MSNDIGNIIRKLRCSRGMTQEQLAENLNVTPQAISKWENSIGLPDITQVVPLARFFGVSADVLLGIAEESKTDVIQNIIDEATASESFEKEYFIIMRLRRICFIGTMI